MTTHMETAQGQKGELKLNLHIEQPINTAGGSTTSKLNSTSEEKTESKTDEPVQAFKQILSSLKDTQKYLPQQFNTFLESMEGKSMDDLKNEAMHLANKAQEEAKKRTSEVADYGKASLESARSKAQDVVQKAQEQTSNLTGNLTEMVQTPLKATAEKTTGLANKGVEMAQTTIAPYASKAKEYLPEPAKNFVDTNLANKSLEELRQNALTATRQKLLGISDVSNAPSMREFIGEVRGALWSGKLLKNTIGLTESAVEAVVGPLPPGTPKDAGNLTRMYNLSKYIGSTAIDYSRLKAGEMTQNTKDMLNQRLEQAKNSVTPVVSSLPLVGRYWGKSFAELRQNAMDQASNLRQSAMDQASNLSQQATNMGQQAAQKASSMATTAQNKASEAMEQGKQMASNATEQGKQMASNAAEQGKQAAANVAEHGKQMAPTSAGLNMGKEKMGPTSGAQTSSSTSQASTATPTVQVNVNTTAEPLKQYPQGGMPSVSLGGTTVTSGTEQQSTSEHGSSKKKQSKQ